jgi:pyruvate formate lyase activating enzyme
MAVSGRIFDVQRFSIHDGPGIRTTVFLKGCPLRCLWCHNPEAVSREIQLGFSAARCLRCGSCAEACPHGGHHFDPERGHTLDRAACDVCGRCVEACQARALELIGRDAGVEQVLAEVLRDRAFYETSGGGLTLSGGEPLAQLEFSTALLAAAKAAGLHTAVETCGAVPWPSFEAVRGLVDLWLFDLKESDPERHREFTGASNRQILANLAQLHDSGARILARLPLVPGLNARPEHLRAVAQLVEGLPGLVGVEVMPYHRLGLAKRQRLGLAADGFEAQAPEVGEVAAWVAQLRALGAPVINEG